MAAWMQAHRPDVQWWCPQLPPSPREAMDLLTDGMRFGWSVHRLGEDVLVDVPLNRQRPGPSGHATSVP